jgi:hypothetical protein
METSALIIFKENLKTRTILDWISSHLSGALPPHKYKGNLQISSDRLFFEGADVKTEENVEFIIPRYSIEQVFHGYDNSYSILQTRGMGFNWAPVRIKYNMDDEIKTVYIITGYETPGTTDKEFYEFLIEWLS